MDILIVSGFLGAGKTTFIKELSKHTGKEFVILENEFSETDIDSDRLKKDTLSGFDIYELSRGCICCSSKADFADSVLTIANTLDPDYLVIEPTGLAKLSNLLEVLKQFEYEKIRILMPVVIVDIHSIHRYFTEFPDIYRDQLLSSHHLVLSKIENCSETEIQTIIDEIQGMNPKVEIPKQHYSNMPKTWWDHLLQVYYDGSIAKLSPAEFADDIDTFSICDTAPSSMEEFLLFLNEMIRGTYGNIIRSKGSLRIGENSLMYDVADGRYSVLFTDELADNKLVFIGNRMKKQKIREVLFADSGFIRIKSAGKRSVSQT